MKNQLSSLAEKLNEIAEELREMRCDIQENGQRRKGSLYDLIKKCAYDKDSKYSITDEDCENFVHLVDNWLPKALTYDSPYPENEVDGYNLALKQIRENLR
jgi:hypothetical protein